MAVPVATDRMWVRQDLAGHWPSADGNTVSDFAQPAGTLQFADPILGLWVISMASEAPQPRESVGTRPLAALWPPVEPIPETQPPSAFTPVSPS
jgi:hypothetical protein